MSLKVKAGVSAYFGGVVGLVEGFGVAFGGTCSLSEQGEGSRFLVMRNLVEGLAGGVCHSGTGRGFLERGLKTGGGRDFWEGGVTIPTRPRSRLAGAAIGLGGA